MRGYLRYCVSLSARTAYNHSRVKLRKERMMKIDREKISAMCALPDDELWAKIVTIGADHGFELPKTPPKHEDMEKLRAAVNGGTKLNLTAALKIIDNYRKAKR